MTRYDSVVFEFSANEALYSKEIIGKRTFRLDDLLRQKELNKIAGEVYKKLEKMDNVNYLFLSGRVYTNGYGIPADRKWIANIY